MGRGIGSRVEVPPAIRRFLPDGSQKIAASTAEILPLQAKLTALLRRSWPRGSDKDISWLAADLAGLWEVSRLHIILVQRLVRMMGNANRRGLQDIAQELYVNWFSNATGHMQTMKQELAQFKASLYEKSSRSARKRVRHKRMTRPPTSQR